LTRNIASYHFRDIRSQTAKIVVQEVKNGPPETRFWSHIW